MPGSDELDVLQWIRQQTEAECIIATDDESFTYNAKVNRLNPIAEHKMIMKTVQNGVKPEKIAAALNLSEADVKASMTLQEGINEEAADLLKDKAIAPHCDWVYCVVCGAAFAVQDLLDSGGPLWGEVMVNKMTHPIRMWVRLQRVSVQRQTSWQSRLFLKQLAVFGK